LKGVNICKDQILYRQAYQKCQINMLTAKLMSE